MCQELVCVDFKLQVYDENPWTDHSTITFVDSRCCWAPLRFCWMSVVCLSLSYATSVVCRCCLPSLTLPSPVIYCYLASVVCRLRCFLASFLSPTPGINILLLYADTAACHRCYLSVAAVDPWLLLALH